MGARDKLNATCVWACVIAAAVIGMATESSGAFWATLVVAIAACYMAGGIRHEPATRNHRRS